MVTTFIIFAIALGALLLAAKYFTDAANRIGVSLNMSPFMIGVVIVAIGTSLPELISGIFASVEGKPEIVIGNIMGANISNILLVLGITTIVAKKSIQLGDEYIFIDLHFMLGSSAILVLFLMDGMINWIEGVMLLLGFVIYQLYLFQSEKPDQITNLTEPIEGKSNRIKDILILISSAAIIFLGAKFTISSIVDLASHLGVNEGLIGLTVMSFGTTLPELSVSIAAARSGKPQMAIGNILGSCIFNAFAVGGVAAIIHPITLPMELQKTSVIFFMVAAAFFYLISQDKKVSKYEGMLFLLLYVIFILKIANIA